MKQALRHFVLRHPVHFLAFGFGSGLVPRAPGTFGTLAAVPCYLLLDQLSLSSYLLMLIFAFGLGIWLCEHTSKAMKVHDHGGIVWDEFVGFWITMVVAPPGWLWIAVGFVLFRLFDILKPFPINWLDRRVGGGLGIMLDDAVAGTFAWFFLQLLARAQVLPTSL
jgi:phosphatidylglycerophosphatase A